MAHAERKALIEEVRDSKVIAFVTRDRPPAPAQLGDDAIRPLYDHLRHLGRVAKL